MQAVGSEDGPSDNALAIEERDKPCGPLVTFIIPTYNRERLLAEAVDSCLNQTYENIEVVVVDDGSTDATLEYLARRSLEVGAHRLRFLSQANQGPAAACNSGLEIAKGDYIKFLGSDDTNNLDAVEHLVAAIETWDAEMCIGSRQFVTETGWCWQGRLDYEAPDGIIDSPLRRFFDVELRPQTGFWLFRRSVFDKGLRFNTALLAREDTDLLARALVCGATVCGSPRAVLNTRCHSGDRQGTRQYEPKIFASILDANRYLYRMMVDHRCDEGSFAAFASYLCRAVVRGWYIDRSISLEFYRLAKCATPAPRLDIAANSSGVKRRLVGIAWRIGGPRLCGPLVVMDDKYVRGFIANLRRIAARFRARSGASRSA